MARLCNAVLFRSSYLFERTLTAFCALRECRPGRKDHMRTYNTCNHINVVRIFDQTCIVLKPGWSPSSTTARMPASLLVFPCLSLIPDATAKLIASSHHFTPPRQISTRLAPLV